MPESRWLAVSVVLAIVSACAPEPGSSNAGGNELVLVVGGEQASLRQALAAAGVVSDPPREVPRGERGGGEASPGGEPPQPEPSPEPRDPPPADYVVVRLERGQTLIHLAKKHLGDGRRFREILQFNGWDEDDARRLREGQTVKIPVDRAAGESR
jgi:nucleoid-associated protein YgaU